MGDDFVIGLEVGLNLCDDLGIYVVLDKKNIIICNGMLIWFRLKCFKEVAY